MKADKQVAVGGMQFQPYRNRRAQRAAPLPQCRAAPGPCQSWSIALGNWLWGAKGCAEGPMISQPSAPRGCRPGCCFPGFLVAPLGPAWPICRQMLAPVCCVDEVDDPFPGGFLVIIPDTGAAGGDAALRADIGHLGVDQAGATLGEAPVVHQVPVRRQALLRHCTWTWVTPPRGCSATSPAA